MGCCENSRNVFGNNKNPINSSSSKTLQETNLSNEISKDSHKYLDDVLKTLLRSKTPKITINNSKNKKALDKIKEEEFESNGTSLKDQRMLYKGKKVLNIKTEKLKNQNIRLENIKILRKNRCQQKFKTKLNEELFVKKLNEYMESNKLKNNNYSNYISQLNNLKESKSEQFFHKTIGYSTLKDSFNKMNKENIIIKNKNKTKSNIYKSKKEKESIIQYYEEEEINKNTIHHIPRSFSKMIIKKNIIEQNYKNQEDLFI